MFVIYFVLSVCVGVLVFFICEYIADGKLRKLNMLIMQKRAEVEFLNTILKEVEKMSGIVSSGEGIKNESDTDKKA